jgi:short-subunit dehydrogenase
MVESQVIMITGASSGIGAATARLFSQSGYRVVLAARSVDKLHELAEEIRSTGGIALPVATDVTSMDEIGHLVQTTLNTYGKIDILFNNAGIGRLDWLEKLEPQSDIKAQLDVNLLGLIYMARAVLPHMIKQHQGHIINMGSAASLVAPPMYSIYAASKFGLRGFTEALRREAGIFGIKVSGIYPGGVNTGFAQDAIARRKSGITTPSWLKLEAEDVAKSVYRLARHPRRMVIIPRVLWFAYAINLFLPAFVDFAVERIFVRQERF